MSPSDTEITRRAALTTFGASALGLAVSGLPLFADEPGSERLRKLLPNLSEPSRLLLGNLLTDPAYSGQIPAKHVDTLISTEHTSVEKLMLALLPFAQSYSHAPISNFYVGVVVRGTSGNLYTGANIEIPGQCLGFAVHAEQSALSNAYMHGEQNVTALAVGGTPCGHSASLLTRCRRTEQS